MLKANIFFLLFLRLWVGRIIVPVAFIYRIVQSKLSVVFNALSKLIISLQSPCDG